MDLTTADKIAEKFEENDLIAQVCHTADGYHVEVDSDNVTYKIKNETTAGELRRIIRNAQGDLGK